MGCRACAARPPTPMPAAHAAAPGRALAWRKRGIRPLTAAQCVPRKSAPPGQGYGAAVAHWPGGEHGRCPSGSAGQVVRRRRTTRAWRGGRRSCPSDSQRHAALQRCRRSARRRARRLRRACSARAPRAHRLVAGKRRLPAWLSMLRMAWAAEPPGPGDIREIAERCSAHLLRSRAQRRSDFVVPLGHVVERPTCRDLWRRTSALAARYRRVRAGSRPLARSTRASLAQWDAGLPSVAPPAFRWLRGVGVADHARSRPSLPPRSQVVAGANLLGWHQQTTRWHFKCNPAVKGASSPVTCQGATHSEFPSETARARSHCDSPYP
jgi:hypothetical protein